METDRIDIIAQLFALQDKAYADQKAVDSFRITDEQKALLKTLRVK